MGLENAGYMRVSKTGKGVTIVLKNPRVNRFTIYLTAYREAVEDLLKGDRAEVPVKLIVPEPEE